MSVPFKFSQVGLSISGDLHYTLGQKFWSFRFLKQFLLRKTGASETESEPKTNLCKWDSHYVESFTLYLEKYPSYSTRFPLGKGAFYLFWSMFICAFLRLFMWATNMMQNTVVHILNGRYSTDIWVFTQQSIMSIKVAVEDLYSIFIIFKCISGPRTTFDNPFLISV